MEKTFLGVFRNRVFARQLMPLLGPRMRDRIYLVRYMPEDPHQSDFFRLFVEWDEMIDSLSLPADQQHPAWQHPYEIWHMNFDEAYVSEVSSEVRHLISLRGQTVKNDERPTDEEQNNGKAE